MQLFAIAPAHAELHSIVEQHFVFAILGQLEAADAIEIYDGGAMDAAKNGGIKFLLKFCHAAA
jgi:hypothetical protein